MTQPIGGGVAARDRGPMPAWILTVLAVLWLASPAAAQPQRAILDLVINGVTHGDTFVLLQEGDVLVKVEALREAGLSVTAGTRSTIEGDEFVSLASLGPDVAFVVQEQDLKLVITAAPERLGTHVYDLHAAERPELTYRSNPSAYVNYALTAGSGRVEAFTESVFSARGAVLYNTLTTTSGGTTRGLTNLTLDERGALRRWVVGDNFSGASGLGGDAIVAGVSVAREFSLAPYFVRHPTLNLSAPVMTPSTLEVYVNGRLVRQERVEPGRVELQNLPLATGHNNTRVIVRDPFGGTSEIATGYYMTGSALARGVHDYHYAAGWTRRGFGIASFDYGPPVVMGRHRRGFTDQITIGGRFEAQPGTLGGGSTLNLRLPIGEIEAEAGTSFRERWGLAGRIGYLYSGSTMSLGLSAMRAQDAYATIGQEAGRPHPAMELSAFVSRTLRGGATVGLQHSASRSVDVPAARRTSLTSSMRLVRNADLVTSLSYVKAERTDIQASVGITVAIGSRSAAAVSAIRDSRGVTGNVEVQRSLPVGTGVGYQLRTAQGDAASASGALQYQGKYGRYELRRDMAGSAAGSTVVNVSGALTMIGGGLYASRAIQNSFALVQVPGVSNVRAYSSNQEIGRTNRKGNVLVPDLLPFYANQLSIADTDVPFDYLVSDVQASIAPPYRGGALVKFGVVRVQRAMGILVLDGADGRSVTAGAEMRLAAGGRTFESPVGSDGAFYFENLPPGTHTAEVVHSGGSCFVDLTVPRSEAPTVELGTLRCTAPARTGS